jgi:hypothetical protein
MEWLSWIEAGASVATAVGVLLAGWQIRTAKQLAKTEFEDSLTQQYREIIKCIPIEAMLGGDLGEYDQKKTLDDIYRYIDLSNEQVFLRRNNRVSGATWELWQEGIERHLKRHAFGEAWGLFKEKAPDDFRELRYVAAQNFQTDPYRWPDNWGEDLERLERLNKIGAEREKHLLK